MRTKSREVKCKIEGCTAKARQRGRCKTHYKWYRLENPIASQLREPEHHKAVPVNQFRCIWEERKIKGQLCEEWLSLEKFANAIAPKPGKYFTLVREHGDEPFGPTNFFWREQVKRREGESKKDWTARSRKQMITRHPNFERERELRRKYGLTSAQFKAMHDAQDGRCAICFQQEMRVEHKTGNYRNLAIDHCHDTGKVRELLCWECNVTLGRMGESVERLEAMIRYIKKHAKPDLRVIQGVG